MGHASLQVSIVAMNKGKMRVLSTASDSCLGGRDFDQKLGDFFNEEFKVIVTLIKLIFNKFLAFFLVTAIEKNH